jgi:CDP-paratose 2-epimerase
LTTLLITGGAGFVGSNLAVRFARDRADLRVIAFDNLRRRGSELNLPRLRAAGVEFVHGDVRIREDIEAVGSFDVLVECSAEASVQAGFSSGPAYVLGANLTGLQHCLEAARRHDAALIFLSTSRVYPIHAINGLAVRETDTRFELLDEQPLRGACASGISEEFPLDGARSLYGATKLAGELILQEYVSMYGLRAIVNRCGLLTGPWQMGKVDQGIVAFWVAHHVLQCGPLRYFGYGGTGKQVRDILHVEDLYRLIAVQLSRIEALSGKTFNVGGGADGAVSLCELTALCSDASGHRLEIGRVMEPSPADVRTYVSDCRSVERATGWAPSLRPAGIVDELATWVGEHRSTLMPLFS